MALQEKIFTGPALKKGVTRKKRAASQAAFKRETLQSYLTLSEYGLPTTEKEVEDFKKFLDENNLDNVKKLLNPDYVPSPEEESIKLRLKIQSLKTDLQKVDSQVEK